ncbi:hypothetical protein CI109_101550 [Kwoniella shandongensis]|uniref:Uncharacterized protein n=1 Tax=Kwoniella shandongensis TaxID=1734106 RepID=A0A5M6C5W9_9TREE|nr:uncharacterized protein CI109_001318 [Kwoniella shandongensis]KAA5530514.1 hypothetical protein CI109_001318 [Kwoniella shandongensis]
MITSKFALLSLVVWLGTTNALHIPRQEQESSSNNSENSEGDQSPIATPYASPTDNYETHDTATHTYSPYPTDYHSDSDKHTYHPTETQTKKGEYTKGSGHGGECTTTDLGWIPTSGYPTPTPLATTNANAITPTRTGPIGSHTGSAIDFKGDYSDWQLEEFWDDWVGPVQEPPLRDTPCPPQPYPLPEDPPHLFPDYLVSHPEDILTKYKFPKDFLFGWATAAQQWEGAVKDGGKGPTVWDWASRFPGFIVDNTTSDVGDLGYYLYKQDLARLAALGGNVYSFSMFWTRIFPFGSADSPVNHEGLKFYKDLIDYSWSQGIEPVVTLFHWDTPLALQLEYGAFASERIIDDFVNYAETVFRAYNGTVHKWVTFNEPVVFCSQGGYPINSTFPEGLNSTVYPYTCSYHLTLAHAKTVRRFRELNIQGEIAFKSDNFVGVPWRGYDNKEDLYAVERHAAYQIGVFAEPIYVSGDWPEILKNDLPPEILPRFSDEQKELIKGTADFFAIDGYRVGYVTAPPNGFDACIANISDPLWPVCNQVNFYEPTPYAWGFADFADKRVPWLQNTWQFLRQSLSDLLRRYPTDGGIYLSEFGFAEPGENEQPYKYIATTDTKRELYFLSYLGEVLKAIVEDGTPVKGTFGWSLVDKLLRISQSFEWNNGFSVRFGVQYVDFNSPTLERTFKRSAIAMSKFWNSHRNGDGHGKDDKGDDKKKW